MRIGIDNTQYDKEKVVIDLSKYTDMNEKYVHAVDSRIDALVTSDSKVAKYFIDNGITAIILS